MVAREEYRIKPSVPVVEFTDIYGNLCQRLVASPGIFSLYTAADVAIFNQFGPAVQCTNQRIDVQLIDEKDL